MARINIENSLFIDSRFLSLILKLGDFEKALGAIIFAYIHAQKFWKKDKSLIPFEVWSSQNLNPALIEVGLVEKKDHGFYVKGAEEQFAWLISRIESAKAGGIKSGESRRSEINNLERSKHQANASKRNPPTPTPTLSLNTKYNMLKSPSAIVSESDFDALYKRYPKKKGKILGKKRFFNRIKTKFDLDQIHLALDRYVSDLSKNSTDKQYIKEFGTWMGIWEECLDENYGESVSFKKKENFQRGFANEI